MFAAAADAVADDAELLAEDAELVAEDAAEVAVSALADAETSEFWAFATAESRFDLDVFTVFRSAVVWVVRSATCSSRVGIKTSLVTVLAEPNPLTTLTAPS